MGDVAITTIVEDTTMVEAIAATARISTVEVEEEESTAVTEEEGLVVVVSAVADTTIKMATTVSMADLPVTAMNTVAAAAEQQQELKKTSPFRPRYNFQIKKGKNMFDGIEMFFCEQTQ